MPTLNESTEPVALQHDHGPTCAQVLAERRSVRAFTPQELTDTELSLLLWAAQGITSPGGRRTTPSAGALYPLQIYALTPSAVLHYEPGEHRVDEVAAEIRRDELWVAALRQDAVRDAPLVLVITAMVAHTAGKYGQRAERYCTLEAGHAAQNVLLQATAMGLGAVPVAAFKDQGVRDVLEVTASELPLYLVPVGHPG